MPKARKPRCGSLGVWPRVRAKRSYSRIRSWAQLKDVKPLGFAGYKVGMTHCSVVDNRPNSLTKAQEITIPATIVECPPLRAFSIVFYKNTTYGLKKVGQVLSKNCEKELSRKISVPKKKAGSQPEVFDDLRILVHTQPKLIKLKKKPEVFEVGLGGSKDEKLKYANDILGKDIKLSEVFAEGNQVDIHAITKGKGNQGPVKRFGVKIRARKSEKVKRGPANLGAWTGNRSWTVAHAGQTGYHQRTQYNKWILKIDDDPAFVNQKQGIKHYGNVKSDFIIFKGSVQGAQKRLIRFNHTVRPNRKIPTQAPNITFVNK